jgi:hypothetical protein
MGLPSGTFVALNQADALAVVAGAEAALLARLNQADDEGSLSDLPTIGKGASRVILENRPEGGYVTLADAIALNAKVITHPYTTDWSKVLAHFAEAG